MQPKQTIYERVSPVLVGSIAFILATLLCVIIGMNLPEWLIEAGPEVLFLVAYTMGWLSAGAGVVAHDIWEEKRWNIRNKYW